MKTAVTSICFGAGNRQMRNLTFPAMLDYADRIGADFVNITAGYGQRFLGNIYYEKLQIIDLLDQYDRVIYIDTDIIIAPDCPNLASIVPVDHIGVAVASRYSDFHNQANNEIQKTLGEIEWRREQRDPRIFQSFNAGMMVLSSQYRDALRQAMPAAEIWCRYQGPLDPRTLLNDQTVLNYTVQKYRIPILDLGYRFNHTNARGSTSDRFSSHIIHYAGTSHRNKKRLIPTTKLTKMRIDSQILSTPWLHRIARRSPALVSVLDALA